MPKIVSTCTGASSSYSHTEQEARESTIQRVPDGCVGAKQRVEVEIDLGSRCSGAANIVLNLLLHSILVPSSKICTGADGTFFSIHALLLFSLSAIPPSPDESRAHSPLFKSLCSLLKKERRRSACLPLEPLPPVAAPFDVRQREMAASPHLSASVAPRRLTLSHRL